MNRKRHARTWAQGTWDRRKMIDEMTLNFKRIGCFDKQPLDVSLRMLIIINDWEKLTSEELWVEYRIWKDTTNNYS